MENARNLRDLHQVFTFFPKPNSILDINKKEFKFRFSNVLHLLYFALNQEKEFHFFFALYF